MERFRRPHEGVRAGLAGLVARPKEWASRGHAAAGRMDNCRSKSLVPSQGSNPRSLRPVDLALALLRLLLLLLLLLGIASSLLLLGLELALAHLLALALHLPL